MSTYLSLVQDVFREAGASGTPVTCQNQTGEALRVVKWVQQAYTQLLNDQGIVWNFLRGSVLAPLVVGQGTYTFTDFALPAAVQWDVNSMRVAINPDLSDETHLIGQRFPEFRDYWLFSSRRTVISRPLNASVDNETNLRIAPLPDQAYNLVMQYQLMPPQLDADDDVPVLPERYQQAVMWKALRAYGMFEAAPEVVARADMEYKAIMQQLETDQSYQVICGEPLVC